MAAASRIDICNQAIAELPAKAIQSVDENSLEARECRRFYPQVIREMLEGPHDWSFQNRRVMLAQLATNGRTHEWAYAYALPADMGTPIRVLPDFDSLGLGIPVPLPGDPYMETWATQLGTIEVPYIVENGVIYTNAATATLEYGVNDIEEVVIGPLVERAIVAELASRLAVPVKKDRKLKGELIQEAEVAWARAMADDLNRQPQSYPDYVSEVMAARSGALGAGC
jgi:hypothetical protein